MKETPPHRYSVPAYVGAGGIATAAHYVTIVVLVQTSVAPPLAGSILGFLVGSIVKYCLNYGMTFQSTGRHSRVGPRFVFLFGALFLGNAVLFWLLNSVLGLNYMAAQVATTLALIAPGYVASRKWVFLT